jgi:ferredoxin
MIPKVNKEVCIGCGSCVAICPEVFKMGDDGKAEVLAGDFSGMDEKITQAKDACPVQAISVE